MTVWPSSESQVYELIAAVCASRITQNKKIWSPTLEAVSVDLLFVNMIALYQVQGDEREGGGCEK